ncbi:MAG: response regulator [Chthoniobacteraceae bacterium]
MSDSTIEAPAPEKVAEEPPRKVERASAEIPFRALCGKHPQPMWLLNSEDFSILAVNEAAQQMGGMGAAVFQVPFATLFPEAELRRLRLSNPLKATLVTKTGRQHELELTASSTFFSGSSSILVIGRKMTDLADPSLMEISSKGTAFEEMLWVTPVSVIVTDVSENIILWNENSERRYGWHAGEVIGRPVGEVIFEQGAADSARRVVRESGEWSGEMAQHHRDGSKLNIHSRWRSVVEEGGAIQFIVMVNVDITEQKQIEAQYLRSQRLESIGTLASGIAHDLNNILTPILMSVGILRARNQAPENQKLIDAIEGSAERGAEIVKQVLTFARGVVGDHMTLQPKHLITELMKILAQTFPKNIHVKSEMTKALSAISGDATQIHQVLLNLCVNARDAMPDGGQITLRASNVMLEVTDQARQPELKPGPHVVMEVADSGSGIPPEVLDRIFDPFFTTKEPGKGTGLGLATVRGIVKSHGGTMVVETEVGRGTTFKVYLPAVEEEEADKEKPALTLPPRGNNETILVVDDEASVRIASVSLLQSHGYQIYTAEDGTDALALYFQRQGDVDLILTDWKMEQMDGYQLACAIRKLRPEVPIIISSGQLTEEDRKVFIEAGFRNFLEKPYKPELLLNTVHEALQKREPKMVNLGGR